MRGTCASAPGAAAGTARSIDKTISGRANILDIPIDISAHGQTAKIYSAVRPTGQDFRHGWPSGPLTTPSSCRCPISASGKPSMPARISSVCSPRRGAGCGRAAREPRRNRAARPAPARLPMPGCSMRSEERIVPDQPRVAPPSRGNVQVGAPQHAMPASNGFAPPRRAGARRSRARRRRQSPRAGASGPPRRSGPRRALPRSG